ncbi:ATP-binding protein [Actinacidiphila oryziradicis]|uniref:ATP-binding protein n=1 Tax=Actinacidiphila oryziradicis TaxID=2571141 RepID=UPI0023F3B37B|nr:ATP-binding protein [Actinacidiphila oryziradicis]
MGLDAELLPLGDGPDGDAELLGEGPHAQPQRAAQSAREFVTTTLTGWGLTTRIDNVRLCVSELACNALTHGTVPGHGFLVRVTADDDFLLIEVHDSSDHRPYIRQLTDIDDSGRGLRLVEAMSDCWGVEERESIGKVVWSRFKTTTLAGEGTSC